MLANLRNKPLIEWVLARSARSKLTDLVVLATSDLERDDALEKEARRLGIECFRGSESDVLGRYAAAARKYKADVVVRICGDRPLVDPECIDLAIDTFKQGGSDLVFNHISDGDQRWPRGFGVEVLTNETLQWLDSHVEDSSHREHVTLYMWDHRSEYEIRAAECPAEMDPGITDVLFDVDHPADLEKLEVLCQGEGIDVTGLQIVKKWLTRVRN